MAKCRNCGMELGPEQTCVFATYKVEMDGKELMICCERCAALLEKAPPPEAVPVQPITEQAPQARPVSPPKAEMKAARPGKKARKRPGRKATKKRPARKTTRKRPARKTVKKAAPRKRRR
jgi:hypothetical protein